MLDSVAVASLLHEAFDTTYRAFDFQHFTNSEKLIGHVIKRDW
jgi:hypothetical protein